MRGRLAWVVAAVGLVLLLLLVVGLVLLVWPSKPCSLVRLSDVATDGGRLLAADNNNALFRLQGFVKILGVDAERDCLALEPERALQDATSMCDYRLESQCLNVRLKTSIFTDSSPLFMTEMQLSFKDDQDRPQVCVVRPNIKVPAKHHYYCNETLSYPCMSLDDQHNQLATLFVTSFEFELDTTAELVAQARYRFPRYDCSQPI